MSGQSELCGLGFDFILMASMGLNMRKSFTKLMPFTETAIDLAIYLLLESGS